MGTKLLVSDQKNHGCVSTSSCQDIGFPSSTEIAVCLAVPASQPEVQARSLELSDWIARLILVPAGEWDAPENMHTAGVHADQEGMEK